MRTLGVKLPSIYMFWLKTMVIGQITLCAVIVIITTMHHLGDVTVRPLLVSQISIPGWGPEEPGGKITLQADNAKAPPQLWRALQKHIVVVINASVSSASVYQQCTKSQPPLWTTLQKTLIVIIISIIVLIIGQMMFNVSQASTSYSSQLKPVDTKDLQKWLSHFGTNIAKSNEEV